jgi:hypothetical protein
METKLPREVYAFAKSMGLDLKDLEPEAQDIWKMLTDMQQKNPTEYEQFVQSTIAENKDVIQTSAADKSKHTDDNGRKMIRPMAGFAVVCRTKGGDGVKVRDLSSCQGKVLYVNICSHIAVQKPKDASGLVVDDHHFVNTDGMEIPMIIGSKRDEKTSSGEDVLAVDVLVYPSVVNTAKYAAKFQEELIDLVVSCVESETKVEIDHSHPSSISSKAYECGRGEDKSIPALFPIENDDDMQKKAEVPKDSVLSSPSTLIESVIRDRNDDVSFDMIARATTKGTITQANKGSKAQSKSDVVANSKNKGENDFKKGFLKNATIVESKTVIDKKKLPSAKDNQDIDRIFGSIDSEWNQEVRASDNSPEAMEDMLTVVLFCFHNAIIASLHIVLLGEIWVTLS